MDADIAAQNEALGRSRARFVTAQNNPNRPSERDLAAVEFITDQAIGLGAAIERFVPEGRDKSLALTHLEDVLTRANRGIYIKNPVGGRR